MAERDKLLHLRSKNLLDDGTPKMPEASNIEYGEIAVNYAKDGETLSIKNDNNEIVQFKSHDFYKDKFHRIYISGNTLVIADDTGAIDFSAQKY